MKIRARARERFEYFAECEDTNRLPRIQFSEGGLSALECFHMQETHGELPPCVEPELLSRALNGKQWHGVTVAMLAEDYVGRLLFASELKENYPEWVRQEVLAQAGKIAVQQIGFVPTFVATGEDFSTLPRSGYGSWQEYELFRMRKAREGA